MVLGHATGTVTSPITIAATDGDVHSGHCAFYPEVVPRCKARAEKHPVCLLVATLASLPKLDGLEQQARHLTRAKKLETKNFSP